MRITLYRCEKRLVYTPPFQILKHCVIISKKFDALAWVNRGAQYQSVETNARNRITTRGTKLFAQHRN